MTQEKVIVKLTTDDLAWISVKLNSHYAMIKKSEVLTDEEKSCEIGILMERALHFKLFELVDRFGYNIIEIPLEGKENAQIVYPKDITANDCKIIEARLSLMLEGKQ